jgi:hypothetical protein
MKHLFSYNLFSYTSTETTKVRKQPGFPLVAGYFEAALKQLK